MPGMAATMREYVAGKLHSGSKHGPVVKSRPQAIAIGLSEQRRAGGGLQRAIARKRAGESY